MRAAAALALGILLCAARAPAQEQYGELPKATEDQVALGFLIGRYVTPVSCKRTDGSTIEVESAIGVKAAPESGGGNAAKVTFFGIDAADIAYCYSVVDKRVLDRRGTILVHFASFNRSDKGIADFKLTAKRGALEYPAHRGELTERPLGSEETGAPRVLSFDGGDAKIVVDVIAEGSDGAKLLSGYAATAPARANVPGERKRLSMRFVPKDGEPFVVYVIDDPRQRR